MTDEHAHDSLTRRRVLAGFAGAAASAATAGCSTVLGDGEDRTVRYLTARPPLTLDPVRLTDPWSGQVANRVFQSLYTYDRALELTPDLADGDPTWSDDRRRFRIAVDDRARFQNGHRVGAEDVAYSLRAPTREDAPTAWTVDLIETVRPVDERTVEIELVDSSPAVEPILTRPIVPRDVRERDREGFAGDGAVGSGPYEVETFVPGRRAELVASSTAQRDSAPSVDRIEFVANHSGLARTMSLRTGQADVVERIDPKLYGATRKMPGVSIESAPSYQYHYLGFNCLDGPMSDPAVREAVDRVIDLDEAVAELVGAAGTRQHAPVPERIAREWELPVHRWRTIPAEKDVEAARKTLRRRVRENPDVESGWQPTVAVPKGDMLLEMIGETLVHGLTDAGFSRSRVRTYDQESFRETVTAGSNAEYDVFVGTWTGGPDPDSFLFPLFHEDNEGLTNGTFYRDEQLMADLLAARRTTDREERAWRYADVVTELLEERVHLPAFTMHNSVGYTDRVTGLDPGPLPSLTPRLGGPGSEGPFLSE